MIKMKIKIKQLFDKQAKGSLTRTIIFTIGHFIIAATILKLLDPGIELWVAITDAIVEPLVNSVWYYLLDRWWVSRIITKKKKVKKKVKRERYGKWRGNV
jgi:uncharacterized membrane protein